MFVRYLTSKESETKQPQPSVIDLLKQLGKPKNSGVIPEQEFEEKK